MSFAEVCVSSPAGRSQLFTYSVPPGLAVHPGCAVWVPFGALTVQGIVIHTSGTTGVEAVRPLAALIEQEPLIATWQMALARWLASYYFSPLYSALSLFLPPGFERAATVRIGLSDRASYLDADSLDRECQAVLNRVKTYVRPSVKELTKAFGKKAVDRAVSCLADRGFIQRVYDTAPPRIKPKMELWVSLADTGAPAGTGRRAPRRESLLAYLNTLGNPVPLSQLRQAGYDRQLVNSLAGAGAVRLEERRLIRRPSETWGVQPGFPHDPTQAQSRAIQEITRSLVAGKPDVFLLHGVTGSGKTEVYLQALTLAVSQGKQGIVLVPEIALTPQTAERFAARFPGKTAVLHSSLSLGEQYDTWWDIKNGLYNVVVGARSALFAPLSRPGLIVMDEEHEWTYKQTDQAPRYNTRTAAQKLVEITGAPLVMGSATPDVETYFQAISGAYRLLELPERLTPYQGAPLPAVQVVDLRAELKNGNRSIFSALLQENMRRALEAGEQVILFFNRRGSFSSMQCRSCGYTEKCCRCSVALSYHAEERALVCHQCGAKRRLPEKCPACGSKRIRFLGLGTQRVAEEAAALFPGARLLRWDSDAARGKGAHGEILGRIRRREADVLIGTQLVAKGLDLPLVTLVGVISADTSLGLPDFRAGERTFQLLSQVAGRAGRGEHGGQVIVQTYAPDNYAVRAAAKYDYAGFYTREIDYRRASGNPPFSALVRLTFATVNEAACRKEAERVQKKLGEEIAARGLVGNYVVGPAPAFVPRLRGRHRWQLIIKGREPAEVLRGVRLPSGWAVDVDPVGL